MPAAGNSIGVAAVQMVSVPEVGPNLAAARELIARAAGEGARVVALPEYFCVFGGADTDKVALREPDGEGPLQSFLAEEAARHRVWLVGGTVPLRCARPSRVRNACLVYAPDGTRRARYDKVHLFGLQRAGARYEESATIEAGATPVVVDAEGWRIGLSVCYDLRFPELYRRLGPVDLIVVPSAFTFRTGEAHWETLLRARAIENQCYVVAPAQGGVHPNGRRTWGHAMLVDPWGEVMRVLAEGEGVVAGTISKERLDEVRAMLPALRHRVM
ncbi:MAG TPA: carbon-nitrogen hydrolase family protein [Burkholderiaceae bacterium]